MRAKTGYRECPGELTWPATWTDRLGRDRTPSIPGHELAGVVSALGYGTRGLSVGQRVFGLADWTRDGTLAEYVAIEARNPAPLPGDVDFTVGEPADLGPDRMAGAVRARPLPGGSDRSRTRRGRWRRLGGDAARPRAGAHVISTGRAADRQNAPTSARTSSSTSTTTHWKTSAE